MRHTHARANTQHCTITTHVHVHLNPIRIYQRHHYRKNVLCPEPRFLPRAKTRDLGKETVCRARLSANTGRRELTRLPWACISANNNSRRSGPFCREPRSAKNDLRQNGPLPWAALSAKSGSRQNIAVGPSPWLALTASPLCREPHRYGSRQNCLPSAALGKYLPRAPPRLSANVVSIFHLHVFLFS